MWCVRANVPRESTWYLNVQDMTPLVVVNEVSKKGVNHHHSIFGTHLDTIEAINKRIRKASGVTERMGINTKEWDYEDRQLQYLDKDGDVMYVAPEFQEWWDARPKYVKEQPKKSDQWTMWDDLTEQVREFVSEKPRHWDREYPGVPFANWDPLWNDPRGFITAFNSWFEKKKKSWHPKFRISNTNTYFSFLLTLHVKFDPREDSDHLNYMMPRWLRELGQVPLPSYH